MTSATHNPNIRGHRLNAICLAVVLMSCGINGANARDPGLVPVDYRVLVAGYKLDGVRQYAVTYNMRPPRRLRSRHLELAVGQIASASSDQAFISVGPVWRLPIAGGFAFVDLGFSTTLISGSRFNGRNLGGNVHFTSSISIGATFGRRQSIAVSLRVQHTSNGGLSETNPGIDMIGINVTFKFSDSWDSLDKGNTP